MTTPTGVMSHVQCSLNYVPKLNPVFPGPVIFVHPCFSLKEDAFFILSDLFVTRLSLISFV